MDYIEARKEKHRESSARYKDGHREEIQAQQAIYRELKRVERVEARHRDKGIPVPDSVILWKKQVLAKREGHKKAHTLEGRTRNPNGRLLPLQK